MKKSKRNIYLYEIQSTNNENEVIDQDISEILEYISKNLTKFQYNSSSDNRYFGIESIEKNGQFYMIKFISCRYNYNPDLLNINTLVKRESDKTLEEGEEEFTHVIVNKNKVLYERNRGGTPTYYFAQFINSASQQLNENHREIKINQVLQNNFLEVIKNSTRIKQIKINVDSDDIRNNQYLNLHDENIRKEREIILKAKTRMSIGKRNVLSWLKDLFDKDDNLKINKATIEIDDQNAIPRVINTDSFSVMSRLEVTLMNNGLVNSELLFSGMTNLYENL